MTIIEIAKKLGVSPSTVSRALNNSHQIGTATKNKVNELYNGKVYGVLISVAGSINEDFSLIEKLSNFIPVVFFDRVITKKGIPAITCNDFESRLKATQHLIKKGCSNIFFIGISEHISVTNARLLGYRPL